MDKFNANILKMHYSFSKNFYDNIFNKLPIEIQDKAKTVKYFQIISENHKLSLSIKGEKIDITKYVQTSNN